MRSKTLRKTLFLCHGAIIAALYVALTYLARAFGLDSGVIQVRFSEMLTILPVFTSAAIPGLYVGCLLANLLTGATVLDIIFGSLATLIGAVGGYLLRKRVWLVPLPTVIANTVIVPFVLAYSYGVETAIPILMLTVGIGEIISCYGLGMMLYFSLRNKAPRIFGVAK